MSRIDAAGRAPYAGPMRWEALFNDMEAQFAEGDRLSMETEISERARAEASALCLADRLRGAVGSEVKVHLVSGAVIDGALTYAGADALVLSDGRYQTLIPHFAVAEYTGLGRLAVSEPSVVRRAIGLSHALRGLARDRTEVSILFQSGGRSDPGVAGVIDGVGRDYFDVAALRPGESRRASAVRHVSTVPFQALAAIRSNFSARS